jgi:hypothetical protein
MSYYFYTKYAKVKKPVKLSIDNTSHIPNIPSQKCGVLSPLTIVNCTNDNQCEQCKCSDDSPLSGCMTCQIIDNNNTGTGFTTFYSDIDKSNCTTPYTWDDKNNICKLTNGKYCLPTVMQEVYCNPYTSKKILEKTNIGYQWKCICNNSDTFNQTPNSGQDCNHMMLCGMEGSTINPNIRGIYRVKDDGKPFPCGTEEDECDDTGDKCVDGKCFWQPGSPLNDPPPGGSSWDPNGVYKNGKKQAACKCGPEEVPGPNMTCIPNKCPGGLQACVDQYDGTVPRDKFNNCPPNSKPSENSCVCPHKYIDCKDIGLSRTSETTDYYYNGICTEPSCVPDPCGPNGSLNTSTKNCECNDGYTNVIASHTLIGQTCINLCDDEHNPCGTNDSGMKRGDCYVDSVTPTQFTINSNTIGSNQNDPTMTLSFIDKNNITCYLQINSDTTIGVSTTKTLANFFTLVPYCDPTLQQNNATCPTSTSTLTLNDSYYVTYKLSSNSTFYLDFINKKAVPAPPNLMGDISNFPLDKSTEWPTLIKLIKLDANLKDIKAGISPKKVYRNTSTIECSLYVPRFKIYITTTSSNDLTTKTLFNSARCGRADDSGISSTSPLVCKDGFEIGGKNRDQCVNRDLCQPGYIQDGDFLCNQQPNCSSKFKFGSTWQCRLLTNNCGPDYYPTCGLDGGTTCNQSCQPRKGQYNGKIYTESELRNIGIHSYNEEGMYRWCPDY